MGIKKSGDYYAIIKHISLREYENHDNNTKFKMFAMDCDVIENNMQFLETGKSAVSLKTYYGNLEFIKEYFIQCGKTTKDVINEKIKVFIKKEIFTNESDEIIQYYKIKYFSFLDENGKVIPNKSLETKLEEKKESLKMDF